MEIKDIISVLEKTLFFLRQSKSSLYGSVAVEELINQIEDELNKAKSGRPLDINNLKFLFAPTGSLQDISIGNGWGKEFLELASLID